MVKTVRFLAVLVVLGVVGQTGRSVGDDTRFIARLPQGTIELVGVTRSLPDNHSQWWRPDGSPATLGAYRTQKGFALWKDYEPEDRVTFLLRIKCLPVDTSSSPKAPPPRQSRDEQAEEYISASDEPQPDPESGHIQKPGNERIEMDVSWPAWGIDDNIPPSGMMWEGHSVVDPRGRLALDYKMFSALLDPVGRSADFGVGISTGIWETVITRQPGDAGTSSFRRDGRQWLVKFEKATPGASANSTEIQVVLASLKFYGRLYTRVVAVAHDGNEHASLIGYHGNNGTATFRNLPVSAIKELQFQVRPYDWVEFKNVSLHRGRKTEVEAVSLGSSVQP